MASGVAGECYGEAAYLQQTNAAYIAAARETNCSYQDYSKEFASSDAMQA
jgi:hypothetical protein